MAKLMADRVKQRLVELTSDTLERLNAVSVLSAEQYRKLCDDLNDKMASVRIRTEAELKKLDQNHL